MLYGKTLKWTVFQMNVLNLKLNMFMVWNTYLDNAIYMISRLLTIVLTTTLLTRKTCQLLSKSLNTVAVNQHDVVSLVERVRDRIRGRPEQLPVPGLRAVAPQWLPGLQRCPGCIQTGRWSLATASLHGWRLKYNLFLILHR